MAASIPCSADEAPPVIGAGTPDPPPTSPLVRTRTSVRFCRRMVAWTSRARSSTRARSAVPTARRHRAPPADPRRLGRRTPQLAAAGRRGVRDPRARRAVAGRAAADVRPGGRRTPARAHVRRRRAAPPPDPHEARDALSAHYHPELGEPFVTAGCCYYRDGRDSVAWHGDTIGRGKSEDTLVAIVSRRRPAPAGPAPARRRRVDLGRDGPRRPRGDGRLLPAHLGARRPQGRPRRPAPLGPVPPAQRLLTGRVPEAVTGDGLRHTTGEDRVRRVVHDDLRGVASSRAVQRTTIRPGPLRLRCRAMSSSQLSTSMWKAPSTSSTRIVPSRQQPLRVGEPQAAAGIAATTCRVVAAGRSAGRP